MICEFFVGCNNTFTAVFIYSIIVGGLNSGRQVELEDGHPRTEIQRSDLYGKIQFLPFSDDG